MLKKIFYIYSNEFIQFYNNKLSSRSFRQYLSLITLIILSSYLITIAIYYIIFTNLQSQLLITTLLIIFALNALPLLSMIVRRSRDISPILIWILPTLIVLSALGFFVFLPNYSVAAICLIVFLSNLFFLCFSNKNNNQ